MKTIQADKDTRIKLQWIVSQELGIPLSTSRNPNGAWVFGNVITWHPHAFGPCESFTCSDIEPTIETALLKMDALHALIRICSRLISDGFKVEWVNAPKSANNRTMPRMIVKGTYE